MLQVISCEKEVKLPVEETEVRLDNLEHGTSYRFNVYAYTKAGQGPPSSADTKTLPEALQHWNGE